VLAKYENQINVFSEFLEDLPDTDEPVWILGECYNAKTEKTELLSDVHSRLWFTYRKKFSPIGYQNALLLELGVMRVLQHPLKNQGKKQYFCC
ncbi:unnamed protein product, partial [Coregonus sp. 'balchen']